MTLRLWHVSERDLIELVVKVLQGSEKLNTIEFSDHCMLGKQHRVKFRSLGVI